MSVNKRLALSVFWVVAGIALVALSVAGVLDETYFSAMGGALAAIGALQIVRNVRYRTNDGYRARVDIATSDERNDFLRMKSWSRAGCVAVGVEGVGVVVAMAMGNHTVGLVLSYSVCLILVVYWVTYAALSRRF